MFLFWVIICIEIDTVRVRKTERGRAEDCDANDNGDSDVESLTELERQFRFQLWPTIRDTVKYSGDNNNNKNNNRSSVLLLLLCFCFFFFLLLLFLCSELYSQLRSRGVRFFAAWRTNFDWSPNDSDGVTTTWGERRRRLRVLSSFVSFRCCRCRCRCCCRLCALSIHAHLLKVAYGTWCCCCCSFFFANFGFDYVCSLGASLLGTCCCCCFFFLQTSALTTCALSSLHCTLSVRHTHTSWCNE